MKGATRYRNKTARQARKISIHAPMKGATPRLKDCGPGTRYFNPRTHEGCDPTRGFQGNRGQDISIHAPMKGATVVRRDLLCSWSYFNPRTHEGCDICRAGTGPGGHYFNPRTHEGCDPAPFMTSQAVCDISIHAPMKGATWRMYSFPSLTPRISIHAPMKGATVFKLTQSSPAFLSSILRTERKPI